MTTYENIATIAGSFSVPGHLASAEPFLGGHIHDSYRLTFEGDDGAQDFLLQRINTSIFARPDLVMDNIQRVTGHIRGHLQATGAPEVERRVLTLVPTQRGEPFLRAADGACWRLYRFIEGTVSVETVQTSAQVEHAARAFGAFQSLLADWSGPRLHDTIPDFHNTPMRYEALDRAIAADQAGRAAAARPEIDSAIRHRCVAGGLLDLQRRGEIPERIVHNDAKVSNVLFDAASGVALCVVDLDIVMPGISLYDFGDMVRSMACPAAEDETDLSQVEVRLPLFEALTRGYLATAGACLNPAERAHLVTAGKLITLEQGVRFLTDFLNGDRYYKTSRPLHNLDRCRTQLKLVESIERHEDTLNRIVEASMVP